MVVATAERAEPVRIAALDWPPYYGPELDGGGVFARITREVFARAGYEIVIDWMPWQRALAMGERGDYDMVLGGYDSAERREAFYFSDVVMYAEESLISRDDFPLRSYESLHELEGYRIGHLDEALHSPEFDSADYLHKETDPNFRTLIRKLAHGRYDLIAMSHRSVEYQKQDLGGIAQVEFVALEPPLQRNGLYNLFSRNVDRGERLRDEFNEALATMRGDGTLEAKIADDY